MNEEGLSKAESIILSFATLLFLKRGYPPTKTIHKTYLFGEDHDMAPSPGRKKHCFYVRSNAKLYSHLIKNEMKKSLLLLASVMFLALTQSVNAQEKQSDLKFLGVEKLKSKAGFRYVYNEQGKAKAAVYYNAEGKSGHVDSIYYDAQGRMFRADQYQVLSGDIPEVLPLDTRFDYVYDENGRLHKRIMFMGYAINDTANVKEFLYDERGNNTIIRTYLRSIGTVSDMKYIYNEKNQLVKSGYPADGNPDEIESNVRTYEYDAKGNRTRENMLTSAPNFKLDGYIAYNYNDMELTDVQIMDISHQTGEEKLYLSMKFGYDNDRMGKDAYYPTYPFALDGPMFQNSMNEDALAGGRLRTSMYVIDPDASGDKKETTYAYLYMNITSAKTVEAAGELKAYKNGSVLTIEGNGIQNTALYSVDGQLVAQVDAQADRIDIPAEALGNGVFIIFTQNGQGQKMSTKVVL